MAVTTPARRPSGLPDAVPVRSPASPPTQVLATVTVLVVLAALAVAVDDATAFVLPTLALVGGVALGLGLDLRAAFRTFPGLAWAVVALCGLTALWLGLAGNEVIVPFWVVPVAALFVVGLDWAWAERLRVVTVLAGLAVLPLVGQDRTAGVVTGGAWFGLAAATLWSARRDVVDALPEAHPLPGTAASAPPPRPTGTVLGLVASWLVAGLVVAGAGLLLAQLDRPHDDRRTFSRVDPDREWRDTDGDGIPDIGRDLDGDGRADPDLDGDGRADHRVGRGSPGNLDDDDLRSGGGPMSTGGGGGPPMAGAGPSAGPAPGADGPGAPADDTAAAARARWARIALGVIGAAVVAALAVVVGRAVAAGVDRRRARAARPWAVKLAERLEHEGRLRDRPRRRSEPVTLYADALAVGVLPDPRLHEVGAAVSAALFSPGGVEPGVGTWAGAVLDEVTTAYPAPSRWGRLRSGRAGRRSPGSAA